MPEEKQDAAQRLARSLKLGQGLLRALAQHVADVAVLTKEVVGLRAKNVEQRGTMMSMASDIVTLQRQLERIVGKTDRLGFGKRMA